jgi:hypothetical protein
MPLEALGMEQLLRYIKKINRMPEDRLPSIAWKASCRPQKTRKSKLLASGWMLDNEKWFDRWDAKVLLRHPINDSMAITACLQRQLLKRWEDQNSSRFKYYTEAVNTNFRAQYYKEKRERPVAYLLEPVNISAQRKVASIRTGSHNLRSETGKWTPNDPLASICPFCEEGAVETAAHALLECMAFSHIRTNFPDVKNSNTLASLLHKKQKTVLIATFLGTLMKARQRLLDPPTAPPNVADE